MAALLKVEPPSWYTEYSTVNTAIRLSFADSARLEIFGCSAILSDKDVNDVWERFGKHYFRTNFSAIFSERQRWKNKSVVFLNSSQYGGAIKVMDLKRRDIWILNSALSYFLKKRMLFGPV